MILTELYRLKPEDKFQESELYLPSGYISYIKINRDMIEYQGVTEICAGIGDDDLYFYVKETPGQIANMIKEEEDSYILDDEEDED